MKSFILLIPVIGGGTGWVILSIALKLVFHPQQPVRLWGNVFLQGLIPGKQAQLALSIREILEAQLRCAVTKDAGAAPEVFAKITDTVACSMRLRTEQKLPVILPTVVRDKIARAVEDIVRRETPACIEAAIDKICNRNDNERDICIIFEEKIKAFDSGTLEKALSDSREAFYLKAGGAVIGFAAGLLQLMVVWMAKT